MKITIKFNEAKGQINLPVKPTVFIFSFTLFILFLYQLNIFYILDLKNLSFAAVILMWSGFLTTYKFFGSRLGISLTKFTIYLLIITFIIFYQMYFSGNRGIVFASTRACCTTSSCSADSCTCNETASSVCSDACGTTTFCECSLEAGTGACGATGCHICCYIFPCVCNGYDYAGTGDVCNTSKVEIGSCWACQCGSLGSGDNKCSNLGHNNCTADASCNNYYHNHDVCDANSVKTGSCSSTCAWSTAGSGVCRRENPVGENGCNADSSCDTNSPSACVGTSGFCGSACTFTNSFDASQPACNCKGGYSPPASYTCADGNVNCWVSSASGSGISCCESGDTFCKSGSLEGCYSGKYNVTPDKNIYICQNCGGKVYVNGTTSPGPCCNGTDSFYLINTTPYSPDRCERCNSGSYAYSNCIGNHNCASGGNLYPLSNNDTGCTSGTDCICYATESCTASGYSYSSTALPATCSQGGFYSGANANCWSGSNCYWKNSDPCTGGGLSYTTHSTNCTYPDTYCCFGGGSNAYFARGTGPNLCGTTGPTQTWWDRDTNSNNCTGSTGTGCSAYIWFTDLGYSSGSSTFCCGNEGTSDDFATYNDSALTTGKAITCRRCLDGSSYSQLTLLGNGKDIGTNCFYGDIACSSSSTTNGTSCTLACSGVGTTCCPSQGTYRDTITCDDGNACTNYVDHGRDTGQSYCTATSSGCTPYFWNSSAIQYESGTYSCCGDDASESRVNRTCSPSPQICTSLDTDWGCCASTARCAYNGNCYSNGYTADIDSDNYKERCKASSPGDWVDGESPTYTYNNTNVTEIVTGEPVLIYANWSDLYDLNSSWLWTNETGLANGKNYTDGTYGSPFNINLTAGQTWSNFSWKNITFASGVVAWKIYANDSENNQNVTAQGYITVYVPDAAFAVAMPTTYTFTSIIATTEVSPTNTSPTNMSFNFSTIPEYWVQPCSGSICSGGGQQAGPTHPIYYINVTGNVPINIGIRLNQTLTTGLALGANASCSGGYVSCQSTIQNIGNTYVSLVSELDHINSYANVTLYANLTSTSVPAGQSVYEILINSTAKSYT